MNQTPNPFAEEAYNEPSESFVQLDHLRNQGSQTKESAILPTLEASEISHEVLQALENPRSLVGLGVRMSTSQISTTGNPNATKLPIGGKIYLKKEYHDPNITDKSNLKVYVIAKNDGPEPKRYRLRENGAGDGAELDPGHFESGELEIHTDDKAKKLAETKAK